MNNDTEITFAEGMALLGIALFVIVIICVAVAMIAG